MTIEERVKAEFASRGVTPKKGELWEAICAAICAEGDARRRKEHRH